MKRMSGSHSHDHKDHAHVHDAREAIDATRSQKSRRRFLVAGAGNAALAASSAYVGIRMGANPSMAEAIHDLGDVSFYMVPWLASVRAKINSKAALIWMRRSSAFVGGIALSAALYEAGGVLSGESAAPDIESIPLQATFAVGNAAIAAYVMRPDGSSDGRKEVASSAARRHAAADAGTSLAALVGNAFAQAAPIMSPVFAMGINGVSAYVEAKNVKEITADISDSK